MSTTIGEQLIAQGEANSLHECSHVELVVLSHWKTLIQTSKSIEHRTPPKRRMDAPNGFMGKKSFPWRPADKGVPQELSLIRVLLKVRHLADHCIEFRICIEFFDLTQELFGMEQIVGIEQADVVRLGESDPVVARRTSSSRLLKAVGHVPGRSLQPIRDNVWRIVGAGVVHNDDDDVLEVLLTDILQGEGQ